MNEYCSLKNKRCASKSPRRSKALTLKKSLQANKNDFFFLTQRDKTFLFLPKFHIFSRSEKSWGGQEKALPTNKQQTNTMDDHKIQNPRAKNNSQL